MNQTSEADADGNSDDEKEDEVAEQSNHDISTNGLNQTLSLTSFLFGNIDSQGQLEGDVFDAEVKQHLASLSRLGLGSILRQVTDDGDEYDEEEEEEDDHEVHNEVTDRSPSAVDYSDITEVAADYSEEEEEEVVDEEDAEEDEYDDDYEERSDSELMPPPPPKDAGDNQIFLEPLRKINTPLAAMLPSKYADVDVRTLFPDFRQDAVLRFSRLFSPGKNAHLPRIWKHVKKKRKKKEITPSKSEGKSDQSGTDTTESETQETCKSPSKVKGFELNFGPAPTEDQCEEDDEMLLCRPHDSDAVAAAKKAEEKRRNMKSPKEAPWRYGAAQLWYDMFDVSPMGEGFDYGFKLAKDNPQQAGSGSQENGIAAGWKNTTDGWQLIPPKLEETEDFPEDAFHMITQYNWEDDIIWNGDDSKWAQKKRTNTAGWIPSSYNRTAQVYNQTGKGSVFVDRNNIKAKILLGTKFGQPQVEIDDTVYSIFDVDNEELIYERWEDDIIWDAENMPKVPEPKILTLDPNDENIVLGIPEDVDYSSPVTDETPVKIKIPHPHVKKSKILLGKAGVITTIEEESPPPPPKSPDKDPFNLSNDEFYQPKTNDQIIKLSAGSGILQHSTPAVELQVPFVPTFMGEKKLRLFHRPPLKHFSHGPLSAHGPHPVHSLQKEIKKKAKQREQERLASGGGDIFFMREPEDLTSRDGDVILIEYCEEFPPALSQVGMCTRIKNYYKRNITNDKGPPEFRYGEVAFAHTSPFLGHMHPGQCIQTFESNMCRTPMFEHKTPHTDFLMIRTRNGYSIREVDAVFVAGQQCPLYEIPGPNSKKANNFIRDFLQVFIYRLFWKSIDYPRRIKMDDIKRAFPAHSESSIRKRLKPCADFKRTGADSNWWVINPEFRLPTEDEIRAMVSPEQCCAFYSMLAAEQRLKDAGYGDKFLSALEDDNYDDPQKLDDEIKCAPWFTTRAYMQAVKGKCLLQLTGAADPTGCGEGFSYVRIPNKPTQNKEEQEQQPKRTVTGTDADLRKLSLNNAKNLLRNCGVPEEEIQKLTRWEVIDVVRTLSTEKAKAGLEGMNKFSRGNRFSIAEHQERYKEECQRVFDLQNRVLASEEVLSTDEGSSEEEDSDMEEKGKYIENLLANKKTSNQLILEKEEQERKDLQKILMSDEDREAERKKQKKDDEDNVKYGYGSSGRLLKITRTFSSPDGKEYTRVETVRKTAVIDTYVRIRTTKDEAFIKSFAGQLDEAQKEEIKRERRRLQEQLRRIKRNQERLQKGIITPPKQKKPKLKPDLKLKCGACGQVGHMRTNKACPLYTSVHVLQQQSMAAPTNEDPEESKVVTLEEDELINVDGTKITLSSKVMNHAEELKRQSFAMGGRSHSGKELKNKTRRRAGTVVHCDYLKKKSMSVNRRRIDPVITLSTIFEEILNEMRETPDVQPFLFPVNPKQVPDYYDLVPHPMDLSTIRDNLRQKKYQSREEFLTDINQIVENSKLYNGVNSTLTLTSQRMLNLCIDRMAEKEEKLMRLEKAINPLLDDDDQVAFDFILDNIVNTKIFSMQEAWPFMKPVNKKNVRDYYEIIQHPMDLQTIAKKVKTHKYHKRSEFMHDMQLIMKNSESYNGVDSSFTAKARSLVYSCREFLDEYDVHLSALEAKISLAQERALQRAEAEGESDGNSDGGPDEEGNYTYEEQDVEDLTAERDYPGLDGIQSEQDYYGDDEENSNVYRDVDYDRMRAGLEGTINIREHMLDAMDRRSALKKKDQSYESDVPFKKVKIEVPDEIIPNFRDAPLSSEDELEGSSVLQSQPNTISYHSEDAYQGYQDYSPSIQVDENYDPSAFLGNLMARQQRSPVAEEGVTDDGALMTSEQGNLIMASAMRGAFSDALMDVQSAVGVEDFMIRSSELSDQESVGIVDQQEQNLVINSANVNDRLSPPAQLPDPGSAFGTNLSVNEDYLHVQTNDINTPNLDDQPPASPSNIAGIANDLDISDSDDEGDKGDKQYSNREHDKAGLGFDHGELPNTDGRGAEDDDDDGTGIRF